MKTAPSFLLICLLFACKTDDPQANLLYKRSLLNQAEDWGGNDPVLDGGWCNRAKKYVQVDSKVQFHYAESGCIPFVNL